MISKFSKTTARSLKEFFGQNIELSVPRFQRNYSWSDAQVEEMWNDFMCNYHNIKDKEKYTIKYNYLLGPVVLVSQKNNEPYLVIDGQQRLATITMLFCAARYILLNKVESNRKKEGDFLMEMLMNTWQGKCQNWKLVLNDTDRELFKEIQEGRDPEFQNKQKKQSIVDSKKLLLKNYEWLYNKLLDSLYTGFEKKYVTPQQHSPTSDEKKQLINKNLHRLLNFLHSVMDNNFVIEIIVDDDSTAYQIFETLNQRGRDLSKSNLIKNHLLQMIKDDGEQRNINEIWNGIFDEDIGQSQSDDEFILESFRSRYPDVRRISRKQLYNVVKCKINNEAECKQFVKNLKKDAEFVKTLNDPRLYEDDDTRADICAIHLLKGRMIRFPILTAKRAWEMNDDYQTLVKFLVKFFFKIKIVQDAHAGDIETMLLCVSSMINQKKPLADILIKLREKDDHKDFIFRFKKFMIDPPEYAAKYMLQQINKHLSPEYADVKPIDSLTLEHILPKKYESEWNEKDFFGGASGQKISEFVKHLGNLTLLSSVLNSKLKNKSFLSKKEKYDKSQLPINTKTVCKENKWTAKIIEKRGREFANAADKIWDLGSK